MVKSLFRKLKFLKGQEPLSELSDIELVEKYQKMKNAECVSELMQRYSKHIAAYAWKNIGEEADVEDFVQDVFVKLSEKLGSANIENFKSWLYSFMKNHLTDKRRREKLLESFKGRTPSGSMALDGVETVEKRMDQTHLLKALDDLKENERKCLEMLFFQDCSYAEIMSQTGFTFNQIRGLKDRSLKKLKVKLTPIYKS